MSKFFVGQRVRVVAEASADYGKETHIRGFRMFPDGDPGWEVDLPLLFGPVAGYTHAVHRPHNLEPILPDGHRAGDYSLSQLLDRCKQGEGAPA